MKNLLLSTLLVVAVFLVLAQVDEAAIPCGTVNTKAAACVTFAMGKDKVPSPVCCKNLKDLAGMVTSVADKRNVCTCLKNGVKNFAGVQNQFLSKIPGMCRINVGFPVSMTVDCNTIN